MLVVLLAGCQAAPPVDVAPDTPTRLSELSRIEWEGGPAYYRQFPQATASGWADPAFFPIGVWFESVLADVDIEQDREIGLNTYVELTPNSDVELIRGAGMAAVSSQQLPAVGDESVGWLLTDEPDMWAGAGEAEWTGNYPGSGELCDPPESRCGYTVLETLGARFPADGRLRYANYGKGVHLWYDDAAAARFVNDYTDVLSTDIYWYTDPNICAEGERYRAIPADECRLAANYGAVIDRQRALDAMDQERQPIWAFVENGLPFTDGGRAITPPEMAGAVMSSLLHEARGIIYFNHNFEGDCITQHVFRVPACNPPLRPATAALNAQITQLAPVLNTQSFRYTFNPELDTMLKEKDGAYYVFAMPARGTRPGSHRLRLPDGLAGDTAEVLFEGRSVPVGADREIEDDFDAEYSYHIYKITPGR